MSGTKQIWIAVDIGVIGCIYRETPCIGCIKSFIKKNKIEKNKQNIKHSKPQCFSPEEPITSKLGAYLKQNLLYHN